MFQGSGDRVFKEAAQFWFQRTLELKQPGRVVAAIRPYLNEKNETSWGDDGAYSQAQPALRRVRAAVTNLNPAWDQMLLLSIPSGSFT